eukprot:UN29330
MESLKIVFEILCTKYEETFNIYSEGKQLRFYVVQPDLYEELQTRQRKFSAYKINPLEGRWQNSDHEVVTVLGDNVCWEFGEKSKITQNYSTVTLNHVGENIPGIMNMNTHEKINWDDGTVWVKLETRQEYEEKKREQMKRNSKYAFNNRVQRIKDTQDSYSPVTQLLEEKWRETASNSKFDMSSDYEEDENEIIMTVRKSNNNFRYFDHTTNASRDVASPNTPKL